jgi:hypothetical protein
MKFGAVFVLPPNLEPSFPFHQISVFLVYSYHLCMTRPIVKFFEERLDCIVLSLSLAFYLHGKSAQCPGLSRLEDEKATLLLGVFLTQPVTLY